jgi:hypothetical protein
MARGQDTGNHPGRDIGRAAHEARMADRMWQNYQYSIDSSGSEDEEGNFLSPHDVPAVRQANQKYETYLDTVSPSALEVHQRRRDSGKLGY